jgi:NAD(P)-dependent dehydrogenase (short-subunit alcohol dehydrogenase family)
MAGQAGVTGANRGTGRDFIRKLRADRTEVFSCSRRREPAVDLADPVPIRALGWRLQGRPVDLSVNNPAIRGDTGGLVAQLRQQKGRGVGGTQVHIVCKHGEKAPHNEVVDILEAWP